MRTIHLAICGLLLALLVVRSGAAAPEARPPFQSRLHELFQLFFVQSVEHFDYTANIMSGSDADLAKAVKQALSASLDTIDRGGDVAAEAQTVTSALKRRLRTDSSSYPAFARYRKLGDEHRVDMTSGSLSDLLPLPDTVSFETTDSWFNDDATGEAMKYYTYAPYQSISLRKAPAKFSDQQWEAFVCDRMLATAFALPLMKKLDAARVRVLGPEGIEDMIEMDPKAAQMLIDGDHPSTSLTIGVIDKRHVMLTLREKSSNDEYARLICAVDDPRRIVFASMQDPSSGEVLCSSVRHFDQDGNLKAYAIYESVPGGPKQFRFAEFATSFHHTVPTRDDFALKIPQGWTFTDRTDPADFIFYQDGVEVGRKSKRDASGPTSGAKRNPALFFILIFCTTLLFVHLARRTNHTKAA